MGSDGGPGRRERLRVLVSGPDLARPVARPAPDIARDFPAGEPLVTVSVMKGATTFLAELIERDSA